MAEQVCSINWKSVTSNKSSVAAIPKPPTSVLPASRRNSSLAQAVGVNLSFGGLGRRVCLGIVFVRVRLFVMALGT